MGGAPERIGAYEIVREIGRGGMGVVYLARDTKLGREVAVKCLPEEMSNDEERLARFRREARLLASLNHPNIATVYALEEADGQTYLVLEYIDGRPLFEHLAQRAHTWSDCVEAALPIADALAAAHEKGVAHRDIKPDNVMITRSGTPKVLDFGLAAPLRAAGEDATLTQEFLKTAPGTILGSPGYMAPEQARGQQTDSRCDIFSFGCLLHEMLSGKPTFLRDTAMDTISATLNDAPATLGEKGVPVEIEQLVMRCLAKDPKLRPSSARDVATELRSFVTGPVTAPTPPAPERAASRWALPAIAVAALAAILVWAWPDGESQPAAEPSLAVLRFTNRTTDPELDFVARELPASVIGDLSSLQGLRVLPRSTTFEFDTSQKPMDIGKKLGVDFVLIGEIESRSGRQFVRADLIDIARDRVVWSQGYDHSVADALEVVAEITERVASILGLDLGDVERKRLKERRPTSHEAYLLYYKGRFEWDKRNREGYWRAIQFYDEALRLDPEFALAYAGKVDAYALLSLDMARPTEELMPKALEAAKKALKYGPELAETHNARGMISWLYDWNYDEAEAHFRRAIEKDRRYATAHHFLAHVLSSKGDYEGAVKSSRTAHAIEPKTLVHGNCLGHHLVWDGRRDDGLDQLRETHRSDPKFALCRIYLGRTLISGGTEEQQKEGIAMLRGLESLPRNPYAGGDVGWALGVTGQTDAAKKELERLHALQKREHVAAVAFARVHAGLGNVDQALAYLQKSVDQRECWLPLIAAEAHFQSLKGNPEFTKILKQINVKT
ncbi:MAG: protein kinase domain-containing protein [Planctomycetota bacterium]|jgi:serine/threonine protein kinase/tetratricopeptide (TPR) repeat protein